jgi:hypothetical protein
VSVGDYGLLPLDVLNSGIRVIVTIQRIHASV